MCVALLEFIPMCLWATEKGFSTAEIHQSQSSAVQCWKGKPVVVNNY